MARLLILDANYPHQGNLIGSIFVHVRAKAYAKKHEVKAVSFFHPPGTVLYEGVEVVFADSVKGVSEIIKTWRPDKILVHFYQSWMLDAIIKKNTPVIIWVHLFEAIGWYRRMFNFTIYSPVFFRFVARNTKQQYHFRKLVQYSNKTGKVKFVFVSNWVRRIAAIDSLSSIKHRHIIPNPIDTSLFNYAEKNIEQRKKILVLRSFHTPKYAADIAMDAIRKLSAKPFFNNLQFTIIGRGAHFKSLTQPFEKFSNVHITEGTVPHEQIPAVHKEHGIFLCPTRQDSQGVSMCEAMSSGLVPLATSNSAIPEFVKDGWSGYLPHSAGELAEKIELLYNSPEVFSELSANAAKHIRQTASLDGVLKKELAVIEA